MLKNIHHTAIICSDYQKSKTFYVDVLGFEIMSENYREQRQSYKLDLALNGTYCIELFSFPSPTPRPSRPEATGLRHLAFAIENLDEAIEMLRNKKCFAEEIRIDEFTGKRFTFIADPDHLPIELYEV